MVKAHQKKQMIQNARKKYMRHLIKTSVTLAGPESRFKADEAKPAHGIGVHASNLIQYYENDNFASKVPNDPSNYSSSNDIVLNLLLLDNNMYMHIVSDYELKK